MDCVLITGAAGFLGSHLAEKYLGLGYRVLGLDNFSTGSQENIDFLRRQSKEFYFLQKDVCREWTDVAAFAKENNLVGFKYVFHFASPASPPHYQRLALETLSVNSIGLSYALEFADKNSARLVFASTSEVYGDPQVSPQTETYWGNVNSFGERSCYDEAKRFGEALIFSHNKNFAKAHGLVRIFNTYGPRMNPADGRVIINFIQQAAAGTNLSVYGDGLQTRSFCHVTDLIAGITHYAATNLKVPVNLGNDEEISMLDLARVVLRVTASKSKLEFLPLPKDDPRKRKPDLNLARTTFPEWRPSVSLEAGLKNMLEWINTLERK